MIERVGIFDVSTGSAPLTISPETGYGLAMVALRLVAMDIDGTLLTSAQTISPATRTAIGEVLARGVRVVLVTGRSFRNARPFAEELTLSTPLIVHNGALVKEPDGRAPVSHLLDVEVVREIIGRARVAGMSLICFDDPEGEGRALLDRMVSPNEKLLRYLSRWRHPPDSVTDLLSYADHAMIALTTVDRWEKADRFARLIEEEMSGRVRVLRTMYRHRDLALLDFIASEASKARALDHLVRRWGIVPSEIMVVGDNRNDLEMFAYAGVGVVMGNADEEVKALGDYVTGTNDEDGVAQALRHFLLAE